MLRVRQNAAQRRALVSLGRELQRAGYGFTAITPATHARVLPREAEARELRDVFGWSRPFRRELLDAKVFELLREAECLVPVGPLFRSTVRFASLGDKLFVHSAYPTTEEDAVFFGPDTYRYAKLLERIPGRFERAVDIGAGSGAGLLSMSDRCGEVWLADINDRALGFAAVNAELADVGVQLAHSNVLRGVSGDFELIVSNPPYLVDAKARAYRHGGDRGIALPARIVEESLARLCPGGTLCVYTGTPVVRGVDLFRERALPLIDERTFDVDYEELDVDVFGEELDEPAYADVERISLVSLSARRRSE